MTFAVEPAPENNEKVAGAVRHLSQLWVASAERLQSRCEGLTDEEFFWEPVPGCWNVRPDVSAPSGWSYEYEFAPPIPAPVATIAWSEFVGRGTLFALRVQGDSMIEAGITDGDIMVVRQQAVANDGDIVATMIDDEATVKVYRTRKGRVGFVPRNPLYPAISGDRAVIRSGTVTGFWNPAPDRPGRLTAPSRTPLLSVEQRRSEP